MIVSVVCFSSRPSGGGSQRPLATSRPVAGSGIGNGKPAWGANRPHQSTAPPRFTLSTDRVGGKYPTTHHSPNSIPGGGKPPSANQHHHWLHTTEPGFVTRVKNKPPSGKPKPTKKPYHYHRPGQKTSTTTRTSIALTTTTPASRYTFILGTSTFYCPNTDAGESRHFSLTGLSFILTLTFRLGFIKSPGNKKRIVWQNKTGAGIIIIIITSLATLGQ